MARSKSKRAPEPPPPTWDENLIRVLTPWRVELIGLLLFLLGGVSLFGLMGFSQAPLLRRWTGTLYQVAGWGAYPLALSLVLGGLHLALRRLSPPYRLTMGQVIGVEMALLAALPLTYQFTGATLAGAYQGRGGGLIGWALAEPALDFLGPFLTAMVYLGLLGWGVALAARLRWHMVAEMLAEASEQLREWAEALQPPPRPEPPPSLPQDETDRRRPRSRPGGQRRLIDQTPVPPPRVQTGQRDPRLPDFDILDEGTVMRLSGEEIEEKKQVIEQTLVDFGLRGQVTEIRRGPSVTQFGVEPGYLERTGPDGEPKLKKVRVRRIAALQKDLALALAVPRLRIEAPVPGRGIVGIEVPNSQANVVRLRSVLDTPAFARLDGPLAVALGQGVSGVPLAIDLAKMPHLLIAGTTGSGKSVCLNAFISCLICNNPPERLKMVMIDPKKVELIRFNGLPHLLGTVETDHERVSGVLRWLIGEMEWRYEAFAKLGAKNLNAYNRKIRRHPETDPLPYIAVFVDELADLMSMYPGEVESGLIRLAQMARATGIHLVIATQRPSTDVITGLIKANFPARISFAVASGTDSRVILDTVGAEQLLGQGDMLFLSPEAGEPVRVQGCFVNDNEIERLVTHWQNAMPEFEPEQAPWEQLIARRDLIQEKDEMLEDAVELAKKYDNLSTSLIQRRLRVGYPRAARLMEALYDMDLVEDPKEGGRTRRTFVDEDDTPLEDYLNEQDDE